MIGVLATYYSKIQPPLAKVHTLAGLVLSVTGQCDHVESIYTRQKSCGCQQKLAQMKEVDVSKF